jgi:hypothetical protein
MRTLAHRLRSWVPWAWLMSHVAAPAYALIWEYLVNVRGKRLYLRSRYARAGDPGLRRAGVKIFTSPGFTEFASRLRVSMPDAILDDARRELLATPDGFSTDVYPLFDDTIRTEVVKFALSEPVLQAVLGYLRVVPRMRCPNVLLNVARPELGEEGSKLWHRDGYTYRCLTLFMCLSDVDGESGPYWAIGIDRLPIHADVAKPHLDSSLSVWRRFRITNEEMSAYVDMADAVELSGPAGTTVFVDSGNCYHKGGYARTKDRLMLQLRYVTDDGDADLPAWSTFANLEHPDVRPLLADPVVRYMTGSGNASLMRRLRLWRPLRVVYRQVIRYNARPKPDVRTEAAVSVASGR